MLLESRRSGVGVRPAAESRLKCRVWIARVFIVPVHHSTRRCHWAAVTASLGQPAPQWMQVVTRATDVGGSGGVGPPPPTPTVAAAGASHRCR